MSEYLTHGINLLTHVLVSGCNNVSRQTENVGTPDRLEWALNNMVQ